ncbi:MAG TPA: ABC transporter permease [Candidatus Sumerlaeota bacterium]|nr:ABC transporter permease [Candidatus Sumerlaeota bacterium]
MTLMTYMAKNALRNRRRTALTAVSLAISLTVVIFLKTFLLQLTNPPESAKPSARFVVRHRVSLTMGLPRSTEEKIRRMEGVVDISPMQWFQGIYIDEKPKNWFARFAVDPDHFFNVYDDLQTNDLEAFKKTRNGALVGRKLAERHGFKVGDTIVIKGDIFDANPELKVVGIYDMANGAVDTQQMTDWLLFQIKYLDEMLGETTRVSSFFARADTPQRMETLLPAIEEMFRNSDAEVKAETEKAFQMSFLEMMGNVTGLINTLVTVVLFAVLLIAASTMALTIKERTKEVATLKALGFGRGHILALVVGEGMIVSALGGLLGIGGSYAFLPKPGWFAAFALGAIVAIGVMIFMMMLTFMISETSQSRIRKIAAGRGGTIAIAVGLTITIALLAVMPPLDWMTLSSGYVPTMEVRKPTLILGFIITVVVGLLSSFWPAFQASRMSVLDGLRKVD